MALPRLIPVLLLSGSRLVKTTQFSDAQYIGDPRNAVRIFNDKQVDELILLDIDATPHGRPPDFPLVEEIVSEAFMPVAYGGGITTVEQARRVVSIGIEKIVVSTAGVEDPMLVPALAEELGSQSVVACLDVATRRKRYEIVTRSGTHRTGVDPIDLARRFADAGAGEIVVMSVDRDGTMAGYDLGLVSGVVGAVSVPVVACGGAGSLDDASRAFAAGCAGAAAGSLFVFRGRHRAVMINYPTQEQVKAVIPR